MNLKAEWDTLHRRIETALLHAKPHDCASTARDGRDNREWVVVYQTADGFCCMYKGLPVNFEDIVDVQTWTDEMDVRPYFMGL